LIITEDGKEWPLLDIYGRNHSLMDLNITRWSKLKYKIARFKHYGGRIHNFENPEKQDKIQDESKVKTTKDKKFGKKYGLVPNKAKPIRKMMMAGDSFALITPEYLDKALKTWERNTIWNDDTTVENIKKEILDRIHSKEPGEEQKDDEKLILDEDREHIKKVKAKQQSDMIGTEKLSRDGKTKYKGCYFDIHNFSPHYISIDHIKLEFRKKGS
jgi:hypothetical protein